MSRDAERAAMMISEAAGEARRAAHAVEEAGRSLGSGWFIENLSRQIDRMEALVAEHRELVDRMERAAEAMGGKP